MQIFDRERALSYMDGDDRVLKELAGMFLDRYPAMLQSVQAAIDRRDGEDLYLAAHKLDGSLANFFAERAGEAIQSLKEAGKQQDWDQTLTQFSRVNMEISQLVAALQLMVDVIH
jgi:HPt (histidine-containing phosphotransfer) domain-containing protein